MDLREDMEDITNLKIDCEGHPEAKDYQDDLRKANVSLVDLKTYLGQIDCTKFANAIINEFLFKVRRIPIFCLFLIFSLYLLSDDSTFQVGSTEGFAPWLTEAEKRIQENSMSLRPKTFDEGLKFEQNACLFLKDIVKGKQK